MVVFGASGDLTSRLLMPAVAQLIEPDLLPPGFTIVGSAPVEWSGENFREHIATELEKHVKVTPAESDAILSMLSFKPADVTRAEDVRAVIGDEHAPTLVYLALPPALIESVLPALAKADLG